MKQYEIAVPVAALTFTEEGVLGGAKCVPDGCMDVANLESCLNRQSLSDEITYTCGLLLEQLSRCPMLLIPFQLDENLLLQRRRDYDEHILRDALGRADAILDLVRLDQCRLDTSESWIGSAGYLNTPGGTSVSVLVLSRTEVCRFIARKTWNPIGFPLLPTEVVLSTFDSEVEPLLIENLAPASLGSRLKRLLRAFGEACTIASDDLRILSVMFALEGALSPESASPNDFKQAVAIVQRGNAAKSFDSFCEFYKEVRNVLVHRGARYEELSRDRKADFFYLQSIVHAILLNLVNRRHDSFDTYWKWVRDEASRLL